MDEDQRLRICGTETGPFDKVTRVFGGVGEGLIKEGYGMEGHDGRFYCAAKKVEELNNEDRYLHWKTLVTVREHRRYLRVPQLHDVVNDGMATLVIGTRTIEHWYSGLVNIKKDHVETLFWQFILLRYHDSSHLATTESSPKQLEAWFR